VVVRRRRYGARGARWLLGERAEAFHLCIHRVELVVVGGEEVRVDVDELHYVIGAGPDYVYAYEELDA